MTDTITDTINVIYVPGEKKPWQLDFKEVSVAKTARAAINYPITKFENEDDAIEVATMLRDIIHAEQVEVTDQYGDVEVFDDKEPAPFFKVIHRDEEETSVEHAQGVVDSLTTEEVRNSQEQSNAIHEPDHVSLTPGPSQKQAEAELGNAEPYTKADYQQAR